MTGDLREMMYYCPRRESWEAWTGAEVRGLLCQLVLSRGMPEVKGRQSRRPLYYDAAYYSTGLSSHEQLELEQKCRFRLNNGVRWAATIRRAEFSLCYHQTAMYFPSSATAVVVEPSD